MGESGSVPSRHQQNAVKSRFSLLKFSAKDKAAHAPLRLRRWLKIIRLLERAGGGAKLSLNFCSPQERSGPYSEVLQYRDNP